MPLWPFGRKRRAARDGATQPLTEKPTSAIETPARKASPARRPPTQSTLRPPSPLALDQPDDPEKLQSAREKETIQSLMRRGSDPDEMTALPISRALENSPHLRPIESERPHIPYSTRPYTGSQNSVQRQESVASRPNTLKKKRSVYDANHPMRRMSTRRRRDDHLREEEIRVMSQPVTIPKRPGGASSSPMRRDSKKVRSINTKESTISLPPGEASIHSTMSGAVEQRGWEIGTLGMLNPRPAVRLSGAPQYLPATSAPSTSYMTRELSRRNEKMPESRGSGRKRQTIGNRVDDLDAAELRLILERDAKRRERKRQETHEKLESKLSARTGRNRGDSDRSQRRREAEIALQRARSTATPPTAVHPAFRDNPMEDVEIATGLGIAAHEATAAQPDVEERAAEQGADAENPFDDPPLEQVVTPMSDDMPAMPGAFSPIMTPLEEPVVATAQAVHISQHSTRAASPAASHEPQTIAEVTGAQPSSDLLPPPVINLDPKRASDPSAARRSGGWTAFFRRSMGRRPDEDAPAFESSFSNTSRESMRNQPLPAHLVGTGAQVRRRSDTPVRTQSRFREDLPESAIPISPPESRGASPDVVTAAAMAALARRSGTASQPVDPAFGSRDVESPGPGRNDTPVSPGVRGHGLMSASLASIDSEGSWLAGGAAAKRQSVQSALSRSLSKRSKAAGGAGSSEDLAGAATGRDADYFQRMTPSPDRPLGVPRSRKTSSAALVGASPDEESDEDVEGAGTAAAADEAPESRPPTPGDPRTVVHAGVRRKPTLVYRDPRVKSREGLLAEYSAEVGEGDDDDDDGDGGTSYASGDDDDGSAGARASVERPSLHDDDDHERLMQRATSVSYGQRGHARHISAGSARLLDVQRRRESLPLTPTFPPALSDELDVTPRPSPQP